MPHDHAHGPAVPVAGNSLDRAFVWGIALNVGYTMVEAGAGFWFGSLALLADAAHNLTDVAGLLIAWGAVAAARIKPNPRHTYGFGRSTLLAAMANAIAILLGVGAVMWEAIGRLADPPPVAGWPILGVAAVGIAINLATALLFREPGAHDLNARGAYLHMAADAAVSAGVVVAAAVVLATGWYLVDPMAAMGVSAVIAWTSIRLLRDALHLVMDGVPPEIDAPAVQVFLASRPGVTSVHDLRIRAHSTTLTELSAHLVMPAGDPGGGFLGDVADELRRRHGIGRMTLQIEAAAGPGCDTADARDGVAARAWPEPA